jgi:GTPase SAR1 family protein
LKKEADVSRICNEMGTRRPIETSLELVLEALVQHCPDLPVFLIGTKKDEFLRLETDLSREQIRALEARQAPEEHVKISQACELEKRDGWNKRLQAECPRASQTLAIQLSFVSRGKYLLRNRMLHADDRR